MLEYIRWSAFDGVCAIKDMGMPLLSCSALTTFAGISVTYNRR